MFTGGHQRFWDTARRKAGDRDGTKALIGVLLLHRTLPTEAVLAGIDAAVGVVLPQVRDRGHPSGCGGPLRKFRYTLANFVSPDMPPGQPARADLWTNTPGVKRRSQTGHGSSRGRPGVVPRRDLGCGVRGCHGVCGSGHPLLGCRGWIHPPRAVITHSWPPAGYLRFPGPDQTVIVGPYQVDRTNPPQTVSRAPYFPRPTAERSGP